ncbi:lysophospholipid acyltransferase family protein [Vibrio ulleungensis]|uniref:L-ornithine N(alpha)-acyltransferase n=1 Tax=Vibrio ulleungensis TaxID=2807619 RepID=A0ABS2HI09_9VIBR|nr:GNAT family N-acyltransferase [Vibrio ulleungensis]MBM7037173.1 lysophospholipid acyltransferase family protein [Vibrio ulleungensis]
MSHSQALQQSHSPFQLNLSSRFIAKGIEKLLGLEALEYHYQNRPTPLSDKAENTQQFLRYTMDTLGFSLQLDNPEQLASIPKEGACIMVSNHPLGGLEGVAMSEQLLKVRPDLKVLTNQMLKSIPELSDLFIGVDVLASDARKANSKGMRELCRHLSKGGAVLIYPSGMVSAPSWSNRQITDRAWSDIVGRLARRYKCPCVPFYVDGRNSNFFYAAGLIHPRLRTALLAKQLINKQGKTFHYRCGNVITAQELDGLSDHQAITHYLRMTSEFLAPQHSKKHHYQKHAELQPIASLPSHTQQLEKHLEGLSGYRLVQFKEFSCYCTPYNELGPIMTEIAQAREVTFRAAGEGTGNSEDSDQFDPHYLHLFVWDHQAGKIVGGYRIGRCDEIIAEHGISALYSRSLYHYEESYLKKLGNALEIGRSFVVPSYQRHPRALDLLWKGIGAYVAQNPTYHTLFGSVSISQEHSTLARAFISDSMMSAYRAEQEFLADIRPVSPLKVKGKVWSAEILSSLGNIAVINKLVGHCDAGKSVPILLRHYLSLNGRFVCFSVNKNFNDALDGLILVDLRKTPSKYLKRYLGEKGSQEFLNQWTEHEDAA